MGMNFKGKILIISAVALEKASSNGRTLLNHVSGLDPSQISQFFIHGDPDPSVCCRYYQVSDHDALNYFLGRKKQTQSSSGESASESGKPVERSHKNLVLRNLVWLSYRWWTPEFEAFLRASDPDAILFQAGDMPFIYSIVLKVAEKLNVPILMYSSEYYVLKKRMYYGASALDPWHTILQKMLKSSYQKFMDKAYYCFYITEDLEAAYQEKYPHPGRSAALYTGSDLTPLPDLSDSKQFRLLYAGNLGLGRVYPLLEIAEALYEVDPEAKLDLYARFVFDEDYRLTECKNIVCHEIVPYDEVPALMSKASMLIHTENSERIENQKYLFSTKIADCLSSGRPFLVYGTREYPFIQYLERHDAAHVASSKEELKALLRRCKEDPDYRNSKITNALAIADKNHRVAVNHRIVDEVLCSIPAKEAREA